MVLPGYPQGAPRLIREHDVVSVHTPMLETALIGLAARAAGKRVVVTHHGDLVLPAGALNRIITAVMFAFYRTLASAAPALVCHTLDYARHSEYLSPYLDKVVVIPPFVDVPAPDAGESARAAPGLGPRRRADHRLRRPFRRGEAAGPADPLAGSGQPHLSRRADRLRRPARDPL